MTHTCNIPKAGYPWQETADCRRCGWMYTADYQQERDWSYCPTCTGEAGKPATRIFDPKTRSYCTCAEAS